MPGPSALMEAESGSSEQVAIADSNISLIRLELAANFTILISGRIMPMNLQEFLNSNPVDNLTDEVVVSPRFKDDKGNPLPFTIKAMTSQEFEDIRKLSTTIRKNKKVEFDTQTFNLRIAVSHTVNPDFKNAESLKKLGVHTPEQYVQRVLLAGELATLVQKITELSGFDVEMEELVEEAKN